MLGSSDYNDALKNVKDTMDVLHGVDQFLEAL
jgi:hypothetical protein